MPIVLSKRLRESSWDARKTLMKKITSAMDYHIGDTRIFWTNTPRTTCAGRNAAVGEWEDNRAVEKRLAPESAFGPCNSPNAYTRRSSNHA